MPPSCTLKQRVRPQCQLGLQAKTASRARSATNAVRTISEFSPSPAASGPEELRVEVHSGETEVAQALVKAFEHIAVRSIQGEWRYGQGLEVGE